MPIAMKQPGIAGQPSVDSKPTINEVLLCVHDCVHAMQADSYTRAYRRFVGAVAEAHSELSLQDINQVIQDADDAFADDHDEFVEGKDDGSEPIPERIGEPQIETAVVVCP